MTELIEADELRDQIQDLKKRANDGLIQIVLELSERAVWFRVRGSEIQANECSECANIVERRLPAGWLEAYEREQAKLQKSMVGKSRKSTGSGNRVRGEKS